MKVETNMRGLTCIALVSVSAFAETPSLPPISVLAHTPVPVCAHPDVPKELHFGKEQGKRYADEEMNEFTALGYEKLTQDRPQMERNCVEKKNVFGSIVCHLEKGGTGTELIEKACPYFCEWGGNGDCTFMVKARFNDVGMRIAIR